MLDLSSLPLYPYRGQADEGGAGRDDDSLARVLPFAAVVLVAALAAGWLAAVLLFAASGAAFVM